MRSKLLPLVVFVLACKSPSSDVAEAAASTSPATATASAAPTAQQSAAPTTTMTPPPGNWWTAKGDGDEPGYMHFTPTEVALVRQLRQPDVHDMTQTEGTATHWAWSESHASCTLDVPDPSSGGSFHCGGRGGADKVIALQPITDARKAASLDATLAKSRPPKDVCVSAEACGTKVFTMMSSVFDADVELGNPRSPQKCKKALPALREMARSRGTIPAECQ